MRHGRAGLALVADLALGAGILRAQPQPLPQIVIDPAPPQDPQSLPDVVGLPAGGFAVVWQRGTFETPTARRWALPSRSR